LDKEDAVETALTAAPGEFAAASDSSGSDDADEATALLRDIRDALVMLAKQREGQS
jgi:hypothetical protein